MAILSHELRTPLTSILAFVDLWEASGEEHSPESRECLEKIKTQSQVLLEMVNNALDMVRVESGALEFARDPVDVTDLAAVTVGAVGPLPSRRAWGSTSPSRAMSPSSAATGRSWRKSSPTC